jgi:hypothetical protein
MTKIPKLIHFIWAGGQKIMPDQAIQNVVTWANANPDFSVNIWIDEVTDPDVYEKYTRQFEKLFPREKFNNIHLKDINRKGVVTPEIRYELDGLWPNYGASSDMLRYNILSKKGGAYFDCMDVFSNPDVRLGTVTFPLGDKDAGKSVFDEALPEPRLLLHVTPHSVLRAGKEAPGTEAMICSPGHPKMKEFAETARHAYHESTWSYKSLQYEYRTSHTSKGMPKKSLPTAKKSLSVTGSPGGMLFPRRHSLQLPSVRVMRDQEEVVKFRALNTLDLTGPGMAIRCLGGEKAPEVSPEYLMPHRSELTPDWVTLPEKHALSWAPMRIVAHNYQDAMATAVASIHFEVDNMKMLNLSAHIEQIACSISPEEVEDRMTLKNNIKKDLIDYLKHDERFRLIGEDVLIIRSAHARRNFK